MKFKLYSESEKLGSGGFSLIEALVTIGLLGALAAIVVSSYTDASSQSHAVIARQQVATVKSALDCYVNANLSKALIAEGEAVVAGRNYNRMTVAQLKSIYNHEDMTTEKRWELIEPYIAIESKVSEETPGRLEINADGFLISASMKADGKVVELPVWEGGAGGYPTVKFFEPGE